MPSKPILLLPPSEGKETGGRKASPKGFFDSSLASERAKVKSALRRELKAMSTERAELLFKARGDLAQRARKATSLFVANGAALMPACQRYSGVVWTHLDPSSLTPAQRSQIWVPSALYGITTANDLIADYRLTFLASLDGIGNLRAFWNESVTGAIALKARGNIVIDLLPKEHRGVINHHELEEVVDLISVNFLSADGTSAAGHAAKAAKGVVARSILTDGLDSLKSFNWDGWTLRKKDNRIEVIAPPAH